MFIFVGSSFCCCPLSTPIEGHVSILALVCDAMICALQGLTIILRGYIYLVDWLIVFTCVRCVDITLLVCLFLLVPYIGCDLGSCHFPSHNHLNMHKSFHAESSCGLIPITIYIHL